MTRVGGSKAWTIACLMAVINAILLTSCQAPAPVQGFKIKTASEDASSGGGLVPKDVAYSLGLTEPFNLSVNPPFKDFHITDYPSPNVCVNCFHSLSAQLNWSPPSGIPSTQGVGLGVDLGPDNVRGAFFGISVLDTETNSIGGTNPNDGEKIATSISVYFKFTAVTLEGVYPSKGRSANIRAVFSSTDGKNFALDSTSPPTAGMYMSYEDRIPDAPGCLRSAGGGTSDMIVTSAKLVLDAKAETVTLDAAFSGSVNDIYWDYKAWNPDYPDSKSCWFGYFGGPASVQIHAVLKTEFLHQIKCQKSYNDSSPFYFDSIDATPIEFAVDQENHTCSLCNVDQIRNPDKNNSKMCVDACIPGHRTSNHGYDGCPPIPTPTPPLNCPICPPPGGPSSGPGGNPGNGGGGDEGGGPSSAPSPDESPSTEPSPTPSSGPSPGPSPTPSGGGSDECSEPGYRAVNKQQNGDYSCVYCPEGYFRYSENPAIGCFTAINFKIEPTLSPDPSATPIFAPRDSNGQFDILQFKTFGTEEAAKSIAWDMNIEAKTGPLVGRSDFNGGDKIKNQKGIKSLDFDGQVNKNMCLIDGKYALKLVPKGMSGKRVQIKVPGFDDPVDARIYINPFTSQGTVSEKDELEFWVDNTPPILKDLVVTDASQPDRNSVITFTIKDPEVNEVSGGFNPQMFVPRNNRWLIIDLDEQPIIPEPPFLIASILSGNTYTVTRLDDRTLAVRIEVSGMASGRAMEVLAVDKFENTAKYLFLLKNGINN